MRRSIVRRPRPLYSIRLLYTLVFSSLSPALTRSQVYTLLGLVGNIHQDRQPLWYARRALKYTSYITISCFDLKIKLVSLLFVYNSGYVCRTPNIPPSKTFRSRLEILSFLLFFKNKEKDKVVSARMLTPFFFQKRTFRPEFFFASWEICDARNNFQVIFVWEGKIW